MKIGNYYRLKRKCGRFHSICEFKYDEEATKKRDCTGNTTGVSMEVSELERRRQQSLKLMDVRSKINLISSSRGELNMHESPIVVSSGEIPQNGLPDVNCKVGQMRNNRVRRGRGPDKNPGNRKYPSGRRNYRSIPLELLEVGN